MATNNITPEDIELEHFNFWHSAKGKRLDFNTLLKQNPNLAFGEDFENYWNFRVNVEKEAKIHNWENCDNPFSRSEGFLFDGDKIHPAFVIYFQDRLYTDHWPPKDNKIHHEDFDYFWEDYEGEYDSLVDYVYALWEGESEDIDENSYLYQFLDENGGIDWHGVANDLYNWAGVYVYEAPNDGVYVFKAK